MQHSQSTPPSNWQSSNAAASWSPATSARPWCWPRTARVVTELGDINAPILARSTLKPLQALASMQSGVPLRGAQVAIACGSHVGIAGPHGRGGRHAQGRRASRKTSCSARPPGRRTRPPGTGCPLRAGQVPAGLQLLRQARRVPLGLHGERLGHAQLPRAQPPAAAAHPHRDRGILRRDDRPPGHRRLRRPCRRHLPDRPGPRLLAAGQGPRRQELATPAQPPSPRPCWTTRGRSRAGARPTPS